MYLSIIIPNYNGKDFVETFCQSLASQTLPSDQYEIIFVDNASTDGSIGLIERHTEALPNARIIFYTEQQSSYAARNYGVENSMGEVLVFTDIDCQPQSNWLDRISKNLKNKTGDFLISGEVELFSIGEQFNHYEWYDSLFSLNQEKYAKTQTGATANLTVSLSAYERVGGFQPLISGGDRDFCQRVIAAGETKFYYHPDIKVLHPARSTVEEIKKKAVRVSEGIAVLKFQKLSQNHKVLFFLKQLCGLIFQPHQARQIIKTFVQKGWCDPWSWQFAVVALQLGFFARLKLIQKFFGLSLQRHS